MQGIVNEQDEKMEDGLYKSGSIPGEANPCHQDVEILAYRLWLERGSPVGSPETDWFQAEQQLQHEHAA